MSLVHSDTQTEATRSLFLPDLLLLVGPVVGVRAWIERPRATILSVVRERVRRRRRVCSGREAKHRRLLKRACIERRRATILSVVRERVRRRRRVLSGRGAKGRRFIHDSHFPRKPSPWPAAAA